MTKILFEKMKLHYQTLRIKLGKLQSTLFIANTVGNRCKASVLIVRVYFSQTSSIHFCLGFSSHPYYPGCPLQ